MLTVETIASLRAVVGSWRTADESIALVPTMGNLHDGHLKLVDTGRKSADRVIVSIFVNPTQFGDGEDFDTYPRTMDRDSRKLSKAGADLLFAPLNSEVYPSGYSTFVEVPGLSNLLCGEFRPTHFQGVTTVVCKLLNMVQPDTAIFGEKDFQQLTLIRKMVRDLNFPIDIIGTPILREHDGLAMSSRNTYLSEQQRKTAVRLFESIRFAGDSIQSGNLDFRSIEDQQLRFLESAGFRPDYFAIRRQHNLEIAEPGDKDIVILSAAWLGKTRLIDNLQLDPKLSP